MSSNACVDHAILVFVATPLHIYAFWDWAFDQMPSWYWSLLEKSGSGDEKVIVATTTRSDTLSEIFAGTVAQRRVR